MDRKQLSLALTEEKHLMWVALCKETSFESALPLPGESKEAGERRCLHCG